MKMLKQNLYREKCNYIDFTAVLDDEFGDDHNMEDIEVYRKSYSQEQSIERVPLADIEVNESVVPTRLQTQVTQVTMNEEELVQKNNKIQQTLEKYIILT